jgi:hypothetical protein
LDDEYVLARGFFVGQIEAARREGNELPLVLVEVVDNDHLRKGSYPMLLDGRSVLVRENALPAGIQEQTPYFNTANYHLYIKGILLKLGLAMDYDLQMTSAEIARRFDETFPVPVDLSLRGNNLSEIQLERHLDDFISMVPWVALKVSNHRLLSVKTHEELDRVRPELVRVLTGKVEMNFGRSPVTVTAEKKHELTTNFVSFEAFLRNQVWGGRQIAALKGIQHKRFPKAWKYPLIRCLFQVSI